MFGLSKKEKLLRTPSFQREDANREYYENMRAGILGQAVLLRDKLSDMSGPRSLRFLYDLENVERIAAQTEHYADLLPCVSLLGRMLRTIEQ